MFGINLPMHGMVARRKTAEVLEVIFIGVFYAKTFKGVGGGRAEKIYIESHHMRAHNIMTELVLHAFAPKKTWKEDWLRSAIATGSGPPVGPRPNHYDSLGQG